MWLKRIQNDTGYYPSLPKDKTTPFTNRSIQIPRIPDNYFVKVSSDSITVYNYTEQVKNQFISDLGGLGFIYDGDKRVYNKEVGNNIYTVEISEPTEQNVVTGEMSQVLRISFSEGQQQ